MRIKLLILWIFILFFLTGCSVNYNLVIDKNGVIDESITALQPNYLWGKSKEEINEQINWAIVLSKDETEPAHFYNRRKIIGSNNSGVELNYQYNIDEFGEKSEILLSCFDDYAFSSKDNLMYISATGFKCENLLGDNFDLKINITIDGKKVFGNYHVKQGNTYTWNFNSKDKIDINLSAELRDKNFIKDKIFNGIGLIIGLVVLTVFFGILFFIVYKKNKENNF